ncbi:MAG TPA: peptide-binding protein [Phycisphaerae bacterium]|nr:peptide-binding protein [Phycisphaerae bacterium]
MAATPRAVGQWPTFRAEQVGGTLRRHLSGEPQTLNPLTAKDAYAGIVNGHIFEGLIARDVDTLQWIPELADRWDISPDGKTITFHLDPRARFSDGKPVTADDVVFSIETVMNPEIDCASLRSYYEDMQGCEKVDDRTVRFTWKKTYFKSFEVSGAFAPVLPRHVYRFDKPNDFNDINDRLVGTGPYVFEKWVTGQQIALRRNEQYWRARPSFDRMTFRVILEDQAYVQAFLAGEIDYVSVQPEWWVKLKADPRAGRDFIMHRYSAPAGYRYLAWNCARPPFDDARVRRAMTHLVWREQLVKYLEYDISRVVTGPFWVDSPQYDRTVKPWAFDRAEAARLLKEAGWEDRDADGWIENPDGRRLEFELSLPASLQAYRDMARVLKEEFRRVGIVMNVRFYEWAVFITKLDNRDFDAISLAWTGSVEGDPNQIWHSSQIEGRGHNFISFRNARSDRLIEEARATMDEAKRNALYHEFHRLLHDEQPYTFLWSRDALALVSPRLRGVKVHRLGMDPREWWIPGDLRAAEGQGGP